MSRHRDSAAARKLLGNLEFITDVAVEQKILPTL